jgi:hypothetical protein
MPLTSRDLRRDWIASFRAQELLGRLHVGFGKTGGLPELGHVGWSRVMAIELDLQDLSRQEDPGLRSKASIAIVSQPWPPRSNRRIHLEYEGPPLDPDGLISRRRLLCRCCHCDSVSGRICSFIAWHVARQQGRRIAGQKKAAASSQDPCEAWRLGTIIRSRLGICRPLPGNFPTHTFSRPTDRPFSQRHADEAAKAKTTHASNRRSWQPSSLIPACCCPHYRVPTCATARLASAPAK